MALKLVPLKVPPGVFRNGTEYESKGRWWDVDLVRWFNGVMRPVGGWTQGLSDEVLTGVARTGIAWRLNDGQRRLAFGTDQGLFAWNGGTLADITPVGFTAGRADSSLGYGYGSGPFGDDLYGTQRTTGQPLSATTWAMDLWGENLVCVASHEEIIYEWAGDMSTAAVAVANAPTASALFVTDERFLVALGADGDPRAVAWCDQEDNTTWTPAATNQAGDFPLSTAGFILSGERTVGGQNVILTTSDVFTMTFVGPPLVYGFEKKGTGCGAVGRIASVSFDGRTAWMGKKNFWMYDGQVDPIPCEVADYVFGNINTDQIEKVHAAHIPRFGEVWWFYPVTGGDEISNYVIFNYREGHWSIGEMSRTCWVHDEGVWTNPFAATAAGVVYEQETGWTADGSDRDPYAQSGPMEIGVGGRTLHALQLIADEQTQGQCNVAFRSRFTPNGTESSHGPYSIDSGYVDVRFNGRQVSIRVEENVAADWRWGVPRLSGEPGSGR